MAPSLLHPPSHLSPAAALQLSQQAPFVLQNSPATVSSAPLASLFSTPESPNLWLKYENLLLSCLRTGDEHAAHQCLDRLVARFGANNERVMALRGLIKEADASNTGALEEVLNEYDSILAENGTNIVSLITRQPLQGLKANDCQPVTKRRIALLRSMGRIPEAVASLIQLLDFSPTDPEAWSELADLYLTQGMYPQAIFAFEEVLVMAPNAWNVSLRHHSPHDDVRADRSSRCTQESARCNTWQLLLQEPLMKLPRNTWLNRSNGSLGASSCATTTCVDIMG